MSELIVPGKWKCDRCGFVLHKHVLAVNLGTVHTNYSTEREPCPNDGTLLRALTWKEEAKAGDVALERMFEEQAELVTALRACVDVAKAWHGDVAWDIYYAHSPEMKLVREALAKHGHKADA